MTVKVYYTAYQAVSATIAIAGFITDGGVNVGGFVIPLSVPTLTDTAATIAAGVPGTVAAYSATNFGLTVTEDEWLFTPTGGPAKTFSQPSRALNTAFKPSVAQDTLGSYSVSVASALSLTTGQLGTVVLEYADDSAFTTNVKSVCQASNGNTGTLVVGLNTVNTQGCVVSGLVPAGKWARLRTVSTTGTPTFTSVAAQEVQF